jgi:putative ABC transport system permease protein
MLANVAALPGVENTAAILPLPITGDGWQTSVVKEGQAPVRENAISVDYARVTPAYFTTVGQPLKRGRHFAATDDIRAKPVAIIDETFAAKHFANEDPLGKRLMMGDPKKPWHIEIVGVVGHVKNYGVNAESRIEMYLPFEQFPATSMYLVTRTGHKPEALASAMRDAVARVDKDQPLFDLSSMEERIADSSAAERLSAFLLSLFAGLALVLAAIGVYGVISYSVAQRTHEIGVRMALGAGRLEVLAMVVRSGAVLAGLGVVIGLVCALGLTRLMSSMLFGIAATDWKTFAGVAIVLGAVTLVASYVPAWRASKVDPMVALRYE